MYIFYRNVMILYILIFIMNIISVCMCIINGLYRGYTVAAKACMGPYRGLCSYIYKTLINDTTDVYHTVLLWSIVSNK